MPGNVFHVMALGEQIIDITNFGISDNFSYTILAQPHCFRNLLPGPSKAAQTNNSCVFDLFLPGTDIRDPGIDGLPDNHII